MAGADFLSRYGGTADHVTSVSPGRRYRVRAPTAHPIYERCRVDSFRVLLLAQGGETGLRRLGELMYESHDSYGRCGLGSPGTDRLVALVRAEGRAGGLYGARITGGGNRLLVVDISTICVNALVAPGCGLGGRTFAPPSTAYSLSSMPITKIAL